MDAVRSQRRTAHALRLWSFGQQWAVDVQDRRRDGADPADANPGAVRHAVWRPVRQWLSRLPAGAASPVSAIPHVSAIPYVSALSRLSRPAVHHDLPAAPGMLELSAGPRSPRSRSG